MPTYALRRPTRRRSRRTALVSLAAVGATCLVVPTAAAADRSGTVEGDLIGALQKRDFAYTGGYQTFVVPSGATRVAISAVGGGGGGGIGSVPKGSVGASASGTLLVQPGDELRIAVGGLGQEWRNDKKIANGGWGGLGGSGGAGGFDVRDGYSAGAGGGASTVELIRAGSTTTLIVAGGGGGDGGPGVNLDRGGYGGNAGDHVNGLVARGSNGESSADVGAGGNAGRNANSSGAGGARIEDDGRGYGPGGGGGGGMAGGLAGSGLVKFGGGGGGAGSSIISASLLQPTMAKAGSQFRANNGVVSVAWSTVG